MSQERKSALQIYFASNELDSVRVTDSELNMRLRLIGLLLVDHSLRFHTWRVAGPSGRTAKIRLGKLVLHDLEWRPFPATVVVDRRPSSAHDFSTKLNFRPKSPIEDRRFGLSP